METEKETLEESLAKITLPVRGIQRDQNTVWVPSHNCSIWDIYDPWLRLRGYTLHQKPHIFGYYPDRISPPDPPHPYAVYFYDEYEKMYGRSREVTVAFAQNSLNREVVLKVAELGSQEHRIYAFLSAFSCLYDAERFPCVLPPLDILYTKSNFCFVVLPRWGNLVLTENGTYEGTFRSPKEVLHVIISLLKGLCFLHEHRIVHRDIKSDNTLCNVFDYNSFGRPFIVGLLRRGRFSQPPRYCLYDFNWSVIFPSDLPLEECRLSSDIAFQTWPFFRPPDVLCGELIYDPFAYDVACMGNLLAEVFDDHTAKIPLLAPLFDRMTTHVVKNRFTASQAYEFAEMIEKEMTPDQLRICLPPGLKYRFIIDRWEALDASFVKTWSSFRTPPMGFWLRFCIWMTTFEISSLSFLRLIKFCRLWFQYGGRYPSYYATEHDDWHSF